jgi:hypothetical protein
VSGYYDWLKQPISNHAQEDARLLRVIRVLPRESRHLWRSPRLPRLA